MKPQNSSSAPSVSPVKRNSPRVASQWTVDHTCGHKIVHDLSARPADKRADFARWLAGKDCIDCWKAARDADTESTKQWLAAKRAEELQAATEWARCFEMPPLNGPSRTLEWGERTRHQLMSAAHTALVAEGTWSEADWTALEATARTVTRTGWWIDQRDADGAELPELLDAASADDRGTENPFS